VIRKIFILFFVILIFCSDNEVNAQNIFSTPRASTYSIVARDPETGEMGVAVQSHWRSGCFETINRFG